MGDGNHGKGEAGGPQNVSNNCSVEHTSVMAMRQSSKSCFLRDGPIKHIFADISLSLDKQEIHIRTSHGKLASRILGVK